MPFRSLLDRAIDDSSDANIGTPAAHMQAPVLSTGNDDFCRLATPVQEHSVALEQQLQSPEKLHREPHAEKSSLAIVVTAPELECMGSRSNIEFTFTGLRNALNRLQRMQTALSEKLALPQSARHLFLALHESSSSDSIDLDGAPSSSSSESESFVEPECAAQPEEGSAVLQAHDRRGTREELLHQATCLSDDTIQDIAQNAGKAVKLPAVKGSHVDTSDTRPDIPYPMDAVATAAPLHCPASPIDALSDRFFDEIPQEVFSCAEWIIAGPSGVKGNRSESHGPWTGIEV